MIVTCPNCGKQYLIEDANLPSVRSAARCKECGERIIIDPDAVAPQAGGGEDGDAADTGAPARPATPEPAEAPFSLEALVDTFPWLNDADRNALDLASIFTPAAKGFATRRNRRAAAALKAVNGCLPAVLAPGERVLKAAGADGYFPAEIPYANTILTLPANRFALLCTDRRLLVLNLDWRRRACGEIFHQFPYPNIRETGRGLFRDCLTIKSRSGRAMRFTGLGLALAREMEDTILVMRRRVPNWHLVPVAPECLCPACYAPQDCHGRRCPECGARFRSPTKAFYRSLALPGLGAAYLRHRLLAVAEFGTFAFLIATTATAATLGLGGAAVLTACGAVLFMAASSAGAYMLGRKGLFLDSDGGDGNGKGPDEPGEDAAVARPSGQG